MGSTAIPCLRYHDAPAMIAWLVRVFGFSRKAVHDDGAGTIMHAELTLGDGMIMLGSAAKSSNEAFGKLQATPSALGGVTQSAYLIVEDADAVHDRAVAAGAEIVIPLKDEGYGRGFSCRDPEGHLWNVGTYDPWRD